jgi:hypothetical protein
MGVPFPPGAPACRDCEGSGVITGEICQDGFIRGHWREACERCEGTGYEPQPYTLRHDAIDFRIWRDTPKRGETDARWCFSRSSGGHVIEIRTGFETRDQAEEAARTMAMEES